MCHQEGSTYVIFTEQIRWRRTRVFPFEFSHSEDDLFIRAFCFYVDMTQAPELCRICKRNAGDDFKITFIWNGEEMERIERVMPVDITLMIRNGYGNENRLLIADDERIL